MKSDQRGGPCRACALREKSDPGDLGARQEEAVLSVVPWMSGGNLRIQSSHVYTTSSLVVWRTDCTRYSQLLTADRKDPLLEMAFYYTCRFLSLLYEEIIILKILLPGDKGLSVLA